MSDSHGHGLSGDDHAEAHGHDDFDPQPAKQMSADETPTSSWVPIVGAGLFLIGTVAFLSSQSDAAPGAGSAASASAAKVTMPTTDKPAAPPTDPAKRQELADQKKRLPRVPLSAPAAGSGAPRPPAAPIVSGRPPVRP